MIRPGIRASFARRRPDISAETPPMKSKRSSSSPSADFWSSRIASRCARKPSRSAFAFSFAALVLDFEARSLAAFSACSTCFSSFSSCLSSCFSTSLNAVSAAFAPEALWTMMRNFSFGFACARSSRPASTVVAGSEPATAAASRPVTEPAPSESISTATIVTMAPLPPLPQRAFERCSPPRFPEPQSALLRTSPGLPPVFLPIVLPCPRRGAGRMKSIRGRRERPSGGTAQTVCA